MPNIFEYVPEEEYQPIKSELNGRMGHLKTLLEAEGIILDHWGLVGSFNRNGVPFITRIKGGNKGFDFDINLYIRYPESGHFFKASIRDTIRECLNQAFHTSPYDFAEDRTSVIRLKVKDKRNSRIKHSVDIAIFTPFSTTNGDEEIWKYNRKNDKTGSYSWETRGGKNELAEDKLNCLYENIGDSRNKGYQYHYANGFTLIDDLKVEYLKLKNNNQREDKCSFQLYFEAISNIYNQWQQLIKKEENK